MAPSGHEPSHQPGEWTGCVILGSRRGRWLVITRGVDRVCDPWLQEREVAGNHPGSGQGM